MTLWPWPPEDYDDSFDDYAEDVGIRCSRDYLLWEKFRGEWKLVEMGGKFHECRADPNEEFEEIE